jgi:uncharacterized protein HemX
MGMSEILIWAASDFISNSNGFFIGLAELLTVLGGGIAFVFKSRKTSIANRVRTEAAAALAAREAQKSLEDRLEKQHGAQLQQYKEQIESLIKNYEQQLEILKHQIKDLTDDRTKLLDRLLNERGARERATFERDSPVP